MMLDSPLHTTHQLGGSEDVSTKVGGDPGHWWAQHGDDKGVKGEGGLRSLQEQPGQDGVRPDEPDLRGKRKTPFRFKTRHSRLCQKAFNSATGIFMPIGQNFSGGAELCSQTIYMTPYLSRSQGSHFTFSSGPDFWTVSLAVSGPAAQLQRSLPTVSQTSFLTSSGKSASFVL